MIYKNPPILEAGVHIRPELIADIDHNVLLNAFNSERQFYPDIKPIYRNKKTGSLSLIGSSDLLDGYEFKNLENGKSFNVTNVGLGFTKIAPYVNWDDLQNEIFRLWSVYKEAAPIKQIKQLSTRYVNRIDIPLVEFDFDEYFSSGLGLPEGIGDTLTSLHLKYAVEENESSRALISLQLVEPPSEDVTSIVILVQSQKLIPDGIEIDLNSEMIELRQKKNRVFESLIKDKTRELFF